MFQPRHFASDIALELAKGLMDGTITLDRAAELQTETQPAHGRDMFFRREVLGFAGFATVLLSVAAIVVKRLSFSGAARGVKERRLVAQIEGYLRSLRRNGSGSTEQGEI